MNEQFNQQEENENGCYTINKLSTELGVDRRTITKHLQGKEPDQIKGKLNLYRLSRVSEILEEAAGSGSEKHSLECRKLIQQIRNIEIKNDELMSKLCSVDSVSRLWSSHIQRAKATLIQIEDLAPVLAGLKVNQIKSKLHAAVIDVIQSLNENPTGEDGATTEDN
tara:strand:+ start:399 stop:896 length:498 start_codon:yes stop_codon:yes gene_type:complete